MNLAKALAAGLGVWLALAAFAALYLDGFSPSNIIKAAFVLIGCAGVVVSVIFSYKWPALLGFGTLCVSGSLSIGLDDLTDAWGMLAAAGLFIAPCVALALLLLSMRPGGMPGPADIFRPDPGRPLDHYFALGVTIGLVALVVAAMAALWNVPTIRLYLSGQSYVLVQVIMLCCLSLLVTAPLLGSYSVRRRG
jgi:hypothetical protein